MATMEMATKAEVEQLKQKVGDLRSTNKVSFKYLAKVVGANSSYLNDVVNGGKAPSQAYVKKALTKINAHFKPDVPKKVETKITLGDLADMRAKPPLMGEISEVMLLRELVIIQRKYIDVLEGGKK